MASLVADLASFPRPPSDPSDSSFKFALRSNLPDLPVPPDPPPDILSLMGFLQLYDLWATVGFPHKFSDPKLCLTISDGGLASDKDLFFSDGIVFVLTPLYQVSSDSKPYVSECGWIIDVLVELGLLDLGFSVLVLTVSVAFGYAIVAFVGTFTAVCRCCPFTAVCRFISTFALMAFEMTWHSLLVWQFGMEVLKLCILSAKLVCLGSLCPPFSFKECFFLPHLSLVINEIVIGSIVLKMVLFVAEAKMSIVSRFDGVNCLTLLTMEAFISPFIVSIKNVNLKKSSCLTCLFRRQRWLNV
ncbi:hypothetical protein F2Q70_00016767 [Brassica cretica]|uniref:Uncharacterized protein n=1 Tax=Brassica cretica TaxID=69181 RepID=A0A8S9I5J7_BRACR|nr:hypothetical protein F2Q70_00016767 [Brassica cretica]KAF2597070.1 hypothetical protein F2Q68_00009739 [Brassica cretica]